MLRVWQKAVKDKTKGDVTIEIFWNATQGDEAAQMSKVKTGQLDGAIVSAVGLGVIDPNVNVLQVPGVYPDWATLDKVRDALNPALREDLPRRGHGAGGLGRHRPRSFPLAAATR